MLWYAKIHGVHNFGVWYDIANFVQRIKYCLKRLAFIVDDQSLNVFQEKCFWLVPAKNFSYIEEQGTPCLFKSKAFAGK